MEKDVAFINLNTSLCVSSCLDAINAWESLYSRKLHEAARGELVALRMEMSAMREVLSRDPSDRDELQSVLKVCSLGWCCHVK